MTLPSLLGNATDHADFSLLLVEDDAGDAGLIAAYLRLYFPGEGDSARSGARFAGCETLADALDAAARARPDIVLLDLHLPDSSGISTFVRFAGAFPDLPVIVLTGLDDDLLSQQAMEAGAQDYLIKGAIDQNSLGRAVSHALVRSGLRAELAAARDGLEREVAERTAELQRRVLELEEAHVALKVLLAQRDRDRSEASERFALDLRRQVLPFLKKLSRSRLDLGQRQLLDVIEASLKALVQDDMRLGGVYRQLTPAEIQVAALLRQGLSTKEIAEALSLSPETISIHRKHIRAKLGLQNKGANLRAHLMALSE